MTNIANLLTKHIDIWTAADTEKKLGRGRASGNASNVYGVKKLRELILELAVRGKLVPQDSNDEPATELLKRIQAEKAKLVADGKLKKEKPLEPICDDEKPFELPVGWAWVKNKELFQLRKGRIPKTLNEDGVGLPYLDIDALDRNSIRRYSEELTCPQSTDRDILVVCDGSRSGLVLDGKKGIIGSTLAIIDTHTFIQNFIKLIFKQGFDTFNSSMKGAAIPHLDTPKLLQNLTALPPLAEQHRIVAKVDKLMALCDQLEQQQSDTQEAHETLVGQLLATLTQSQMAAEFIVNWQRIYSHFDLLFTTEVSIDALKKTLLQLAVMGKLVPQDPNDEPASELLKCIQAEKTKLIAEGKVNRKPLSSTLKIHKSPPDLPNNWIVTEVENFTECLDSLRVPINKEERELRFGEVPYYGANGQVGWINEYLFNEDLVLVVEDETFIGRVKPFSYMVKGKSWVNNHAHVLRPKGGISVEYLNLCLQYYDFVPLTSGTTARRKLTQRGLMAATVWLAPLLEQQRIVTKIDVLMALCDQLKTRIQQANQQQRVIADALVAQALLPNKAEVIDLAEYRKSLTSYVINAQHSNPTFGRTQAEKVLAFSQNHIGLDIELQFTRRKAGPYSGWMEVFEAEAKEKGWISVRTKQLSDTKYKYEYGVNSTLIEQTIYFENNCPVQQKHELDRLLKLFDNLNTEQAEIIATLFCAWNDFLIMGNLPTDDEVIREVRESWHPSKERFAPEQLTKWLNWLRENNIVPTGKGSKTIKIGHQKKLIN